MNIKKRIISMLTACGLLFTGMPAADFSSFIAAASSDTEDDFLRGDISGNGKIDLYDAIIIAESLVGKRKFTAEETDLADFNGDGRVDLYDAIGIANYILTGKLPVIPSAAISNVKWVGKSVNFEISYKNINEAKIFIVPANVVKKNNDVQTVFMNYRSLSEFQSGLEGSLSTTDFAAGDYELRVYNSGKLLCCEPFTVGGKQETLFSTFNKLTVGNKPRSEVVFTPQKDCRIYSISTYHWNNGKGMKSPGSIEVFDNGQSFGKLPVLGFPGQNGAENVTWTGYPAIAPNGHQSDPSDKFTGFVMKKGHTYTITDSDPDTWSCNSGSDYKGFVEIKGSYIDDTAEPAVTTAITAVTSPADIPVTTTVPVTSAVTTSSVSVSTTVNTAPSGTDGTAFVIKDGNSASFKTEMRKGLIVSAEENAFEYDGQLKMSEIDDKTADNINEEFYEANYALLDCWKVDAELAPDEYLPGSFHCEYDLSELGIPENMYDRVRVMRRDDNGSTEMYQYELDGNTLSWNSSQNSLFGIAIGVIAGGYLIQGVADYKDTVFKTGKTESKHFVYYYNDPESNKDKIVKIEKETWDKALKDAKENIEAADDGSVYQNKLAKNALINIQALKFKDSYLKDNNDYQTLKKGEPLPPADINKIMDYCEDAYNYLTDELKAQAPDRKISVVCMDNDKMEEWGLKINPTSNFDIGITTLKIKTRKPYIQIRRPETADVMSDAYINNNIILTATHELFHLFTTDHYPGNNLNCLEFAEMTAMWTESECIDYYLKNGIFINEKNENGVVFGRDEYENNSSHQYLFKKGINYRYDYKDDVQHKGYALSRFASFLEKKTETKNMNPWTMSLLYNKKYQKSGSVTDLLKEAFDLTDKELENAWTEYAQKDYDSIINATDKYAQKTFVFKKGGDTKQTYDITPADYSINGYSVECDRSTYINKKWAFMVRSDSEGNYGNLFTDLPKKTPKLTLKFDMYKTKKGIVMAQTNPLPSGGQFAEYQGVGVPKGGKFSVYIFMQPDAPKVEYNENTEKFIVTLPENIKTAAAEDGIIDGYRINFYVNNSKDPISKILTLENADKPYEIAVSELKTEAGKKAEISVDIQEYIGKTEGYQEFAGPASEKASANVSAKPEEVISDEYVWVLSDVTVSAEEGSDELNHVVNRKSNYTVYDNDGNDIEKTGTVSANIRCKKAPPKIIKNGDTVALELFIENPSASPSDYSPKINGYVFLDYLNTFDEDIFIDIGGSGGNTGINEDEYYFRSTDGSDNYEVSWSPGEKNKLSDTFVYKWNVERRSQTIVFSSSSGTTKWKYKPVPVNELCKWELTSAVNEPNDNYADDQNTYEYKISEVTENNVKKSVHVFSARNSAEDLEDEIAVFTAKCIVPEKIYQTFDDIILDMSMELENKAKVIPWENTSKVYVQKITDDSAPVYLKGKDGGSDRCFRKTINLDGSEPEQIPSASVEGQVSAAYNKTDKWEIVFESKAGKTRWIYEYAGAADHNS